MHEYRGSRTMREILKVHKLTNALQTVDLASLS